MSIICNELSIRPGAWGMVWDATSCRNREELRIKIRESLRVEEGGRDDVQYWRVIRMNWWKESWRLWKRCGDDEAMEMRWERRWERHLKADDEGMNLVERGGKREWRRIERDVDDLWYRKRLWRSGNNERNRLDVRQSLKYEMKFFNKSIDNRRNGD